MSTRSAKSSSLIHYDAERRRLWIAGQRCHHGATGALLAAAAAGTALSARLHREGRTVSADVAAAGAELALAGAELAVAGRVAARRSRGVVALAAAGTALMAHDWHDRSIWFQRGWQNQP